jgi:hypothetical protein
MNCNVTQSLFLNPGLIWAESVVITPIYRKNWLQIAVNFEIKSTKTISYAFRVVHFFGISPSIAQGF